MRTAMNCADRLVAIFGSQAPLPPPLPPVMGARAVEAQPARNFRLAAEESDETFRAIHIEASIKLSMSKKY